jgi:hypothetical protein
MIDVEMQSSMMMVPYKEPSQDDGDGSDTETDDHKPATSVDGFFTAETLFGYD